MLRGWCSACVCVCVFHPDRDGVKMESGRQRHPSGGVSAKEMVIGLEGVELGADGKVRPRRWRALRSAAS